MFVKILIYGDVLKCVFSNWVGDVALVLKKSQRSARKVRLMLTFLDGVPRFLGLKQEFSFFFQFIDK